MSSSASSFVRERGSGPVALRVLILEDQPDDAELMLRELKRAGFKPISQLVQTESEYLAALESSFDVILADYNLPGFNGIQAVRRLQERNLDIPLIIVTGALGDEAASQCIKEGAADYLLKDRLGRLAPAVFKVLEQHCVRHEKRQLEEDLRRAHGDLERRVKERTAELEAANERTRLIIDTAHDAFVSINSKGVILEWNPQAEVIFGWSRAQALGRSLAETIIPRLTGKRTTEV